MTLDFFRAKEYLEKMLSNYPNINVSIAEKSEAIRAIIKAAPGCNDPKAFDSYIESTIYNTLANTINNYIASNL